VYRLSNIRLRYTGLVNFVARLLTIVTGFLFVVTVTRNLATTDFGVWQNIGDVLGYMLVLAGIIPFSTVRYAARGYRDAIKTGVVANVLLSLPLTGVFLLLAPSLASTIGANPLHFQIASLQILLFYLLQVVQGAVHATTPHILAYGTVIYEVTKIILGVALVTYFGIGLLGAIVTVIVSQATLSLFYLASIRDYLREGVNWSYLRSWWKVSFISLYSILGERLGSLGLILLVLIWGAVARAYFGAALTIAVMITYSNALATALYPRLLTKTDSVAVETVLKMTMLFAIPMTGGVIILSNSLLTILKPDYAAASLLLSILAVTCLLDSFSAIMNTIIIATEKVDMNTDTKLKELVKSRFFLLPTLTYVGVSIYLPLLLVLLKWFATDPLQAALYTSLAGILANIPIFLLRYRTAERSLPFRLPVSHLARYIFATALMMVVLSQINLAATLSRVFILVLVGGAVYFGTVLAIDPETRTLIETTVNFIKEKLGYGVMRPRRQT